MSTMHALIWLYLFVSPLVILVCAFNYLAAKREGRRIREGNPAGWYVRIGKLNPMNTNMSDLEYCGFARKVSAFTAVLFLIAFVLALVVYLVTR